MVVILQAAAGLLGFAGLATAAAVVLCMLVLDRAFSARGSSPEPGNDLKIEPIDTDALPSPPEPTDADLGVDFEAFQSSVERECDLALSRLRDDAIDGQALRSLAEDLVGVDSAQAVYPPALHGGDPRLCFEVLQGIQDGLKTFQAQVEQHRDLALESGLDLAIDGQCDLVLKNIECECGCPSASDDETDLEEIEEALSRQADEARSLCADSLLNETLQEYHEELLYELEMVDQQVPRKSLHDRIVQHIRRARGLYLLWAI